MFEFLFKNDSVPHLLCWCSAILCLDMDNHDVRNMNYSGLQGIRLRSLFWEFFHGKQQINSTLV